MGNGQGGSTAEIVKDKIYKTWNDRINNSPGGIIILEDSEEYKPITINPKDSQLLESRQFNAVDICSFFSVSPVKAFDLSKSSYSTLEATQLAYLSETVQPFITKIELEINRKVFLPSERKHTTLDEPQKFSGTSVTVQPEKGEASES
ncbi:phage portal protein, HK97 family [Bacteroidales bacterium Barb6XT]|nr:phage portal protein, HK97 family [Bacteroidales bacterium Barb6XT]